MGRCHGSGHQDKKFLHVHFGNMLLLLKEVVQE
jgi:hypothetical protein